MMIMDEPAATTGDLHEVTIQDHDGRILPLADYLGRADTVVAFFYTRCQNPNKCSLTITKLGDLQRRLDDLGMAGIQLAAITYDPGFDLPDRLAAYARARGMILGTRSGCCARLKGMINCSGSSVCGWGTTARS